MDIAVVRMVWCRVGVVAVCRCAIVASPAEKAIPGVVAAVGQQRVVHGTMRETRLTRPTSCLFC